MDELCRVGGTEVTAAAVTVDKDIRESGAVRLSPPTAELSTLLEGLGCKLFPVEVPLHQYVVWAWDAGLFARLERGDALTQAELRRDTPLNEQGTDAIVGVLAALGILERSSAGCYRMSEAGRTYLGPSSPFCIGPHISVPRRSIPRPYMRGGKNLRWRLKHRWLQRFSAYRFGSMERLANQHARNLPAGIAAAESGVFAGARCVADIAGGTGTFAIPLTQKYPDVRVVLTELPRAVPNVRRFLSGFSPQRIELVEMNVFEKRWRLAECDAMFIGNLLHAFGDAECFAICRRAYESLPPGGTLWLHEIVWNDNKDGPLIAALWNAMMRLASGRQRTVDELKRMLTGAGFVPLEVVPTRDAFVLVGARKPKAFESAHGSP